MNMKLFTAAVAMTVGTLCASESQYLYWKVDLDDDPDEYEFYYATVKQNGTLLSNNTEGGSALGEYVTNVEFGDGSGTSWSTPSVYAYDVTGYASSTFLFELWDAKDKKVGWTTVSGSSLGEYVGGSMSTVSSPFTISEVVPEATSGLLLLLGMAGLAIKRKRI